MTPSRPTLDDIVIKTGGQPYVSTNGWHWFSTIAINPNDKGHYPRVKFGGIYAKVPDMEYDDKNFPPNQHELDQWVRSHGVEPVKQQPQQAWNSHDYID